VDKAEVDHTPLDSNLSPEFYSIRPLNIALVRRICSMIPDGSIGSRKWIVNSRYCKFSLRVLSPLFHWGTFGLRLKIPVPSGSYFPGSCKRMSSLITSYCLQCAKINFDFFTKHRLGNARHADPGECDLELGTTQWVNVSITANTSNPPWCTSYVSPHSQIHANA
jgi:hypothetical protein